MSAGGSGGFPRLSSAAGASLRRWVRWRREVRAEITIEAPFERVWSLLTDLASYREWNRFMPRVSGDLRPGGVLWAEVRFRRGFLGLPFRFQADVLRCDDCREIRWTGKLFSRRVLLGVHSLTLEPDTADETNGNGAPAPSAAARVRLVHREELSGLLVPLVGWYLAPRMEEGFREMNEAIRERATAAPPAML